MPPTDRLLRLTPYATKLVAQKDIQKQLRKKDLPNPVFAGLTVVAGRPQKGLPMLAENRAAPWRLSA